MEHPSSMIAHQGFLLLPGALIETLLGQTVQSWRKSLYKSLNRLWSSLQYRAEAELDTPSSTYRATKNFHDPILVDPEERKICLSAEDAEIVMGRLGLRWAGGWDGRREMEMIDGGEVLRVFEEMEPSLDEVREAFGVFDSNGDGFIDAEELQRVMGALGFEEGKEAEECERMIRGFDENGDGRIEFREFVKMMENCFC